MSDATKLSTIEEAIEEFKAGNFIIVVDDEDRENEGDFIIAAEKRDVAYCAPPSPCNAAPSWVSTSR